MFYDHEIPRVYSSVPVQLDILKRPIVWFKPYLTSLGQLLLYRFKTKPMELRAATQLRKRIIQMDDGTELLMALSNIINPRAIVLYLHTVCGNYTQLAHIARLVGNDKFAYVSYTRSGNDGNLRSNKFNFIGRIDELQLVIAYIQSIYPGVPIHAIGASAGSALLIRYLGKHNQLKTIKSAILVSPGYDFIQSFEYMNGFTKAYLVNKMKYMIRHLPYKDDIDAVRTLDDWVVFQSKLNGYGSRDEYVKDCNPVYYLDKINVPSLFISSLDDTIFNGDLTKQYLSLPNVNPNVVLVVTKRGGHVIFEDEGYNVPWFLRVAQQWIRKNL